jgi:hypothetical protein
MNIEQELVVVLGFKHPTCEKPVRQLKELKMQLPELYPL